MSADQFELNCSVRTDSGKGASRRLRRLHNAIPAIIYGGNKDPMALTIDHDDILHATENEAFFTQVITMNIGKKKRKGRGQSAPASSGKAFHHTCRLSAHRRKAGDHGESAAALHQ